MGQPITVVAKPSSSRPDIVRFEINRPLSGMGHERYLAGQPIPVGAHRPPDELARRLFERGGVDAIHVNGSVITVELAEGGTAEGMVDIIRDLFVFYHEDSLEEPATGGDDGAGVH
jgi:hypothetical protein